jgi:hypothetical protein
MTAMQKASSTLQTLDENMPVRTKLSAIVAVCVAAYAVGGWVKATNTTGDENTKAIAAVSEKIDRVESKVDAQTGAIQQIGSDVRSVLRLRVVVPPMGEPTAQTSPAEPWVVTQGP